MSEPTPPQSEQPHSEPAQNQQAHSEQVLRRRPTPGRNRTVPKELRGPLAEHSVTVPASREMVWALLTTPAGLPTWYTIGGGAEVDLRVGGKLRLWWQPTEKFHCEIATVEAPRRFDYWQPQAANTGLDHVDATLVQFMITEAPDEESASVIAVRESGFANCPTPRRRTRCRRWRGWVHWG